jgi:hypothetical protein
MFEVTDAGSDSLYANDNSRMIKITLKNTGTDTARKIIIRLQPMFPFSTDGSVRYIDILEPGKSSDAEFSLAFDKDGTPGNYVLDMLVDYEDEQGKSLHDTAKVSLTLKSKNIFRLVFLDYWFIWVGVIIIVVLIRRKKVGKVEVKKRK